MSPVLSWSPPLRGLGSPRRGRSGSLVAGKRVTNVSMQKVVLSGLAGGPQTAMGLCRVLRRRLHACGGVPDDGLHRTLRRFADEGWVEIRGWAAPHQRSPVWALTRAGEERVERWVGSTANNPGLPSRLATLLVVASCLPPTAPKPWGAMLRERHRLQAETESTPGEESEGPSGWRRARTQAEIRLVERWLLRPGRA